MATNFNFDTKILGLILAQVDEIWCGVLSWQTFYKIYGHIYLTNDLPQFLNWEKFVTAGYCGRASEKTNKRF